MKPHFLDGYQKYLKGQDQVATDQFFQDDSDDPDEFGEGSRTKKRSQTNKKPTTRVSQYFAHIKHDKTKINRTEVVTDAMKKEWWYDMFDVERAKFDVRRVNEDERPMFLFFLWS